MSKVPGVGFVVHFTQCAGGFQPPLVAKARTARAHKRHRWGSAIRSLLEEIHLLENPTEPVRD